MFVLNTPFHCYRHMNSITQSLTHEFGYIVCVPALFLNEPVLQCAGQIVDEYSAGK